MEYMDSDIELREELEKIFNPLLTDQDVLSKLNKLKPEYKQKISIYKSKDECISEFTENFVCFEFAMGLNSSKPYQNIRKKLNHSYMSGIYCNSDFITWLIKKNKLNTAVKKGMDILIVYKDRLTIKHAGIFMNSNDENSQILSKFGSGNIYQHSINAIPINYGLRHECYEKPELHQVEDYFKEYLTESICNIEKIISKL